MDKNKMQEYKVAPTGLWQSDLGAKKPTKFQASQIQGVNDMALRLGMSGGFRQQDRMIFDKKRTLDRVLKYSYQSAIIKKVIDDATINDLFDCEKPSDRPIRALINSNKLKQDYDEKIVSIPKEDGFKCGDVFEWQGTNTKWLIYLQELTELAYFRGNARRCSYEIKWKDKNGNIHSIPAAVKGPEETKITSIQKHGVMIDEPNWSLSIMLQLNEYTAEYFKRYSRFYLCPIGKNLSEDALKCYRVEAIDGISTPGILQIEATEYYENKDVDDIENGIADGLIEDQKNPNNTEVEEMIEGETFIRPRKTYTYHFTGGMVSDWVINSTASIEAKEVDEYTIAIKWNSSYGGQFELTYGTYTKTIVVESLF